MLTFSGTEATCKSCHCLETFSTSQPTQEPARQGTAKFCGLPVVAHASRHRSGSHSCWGRCRRRLAATGLRRGHVKSGIPSTWLSDRDGSYQDKQLDNSGCGGVFFSSGGPGGLPQSAPHADRRGRGLHGSLPGLCPAPPRPRPRRGRRTGLAEVLTRPADQSIFVETFPNVTSVTHEAHRFACLRPRAERLLAGSPNGAPQGLESPSCGKTMIRGRTGRYLTAGR